MQILAQKLDVTLKISQLKEAEETCNCSGWCAINHKHSWKKSSSKELNLKCQTLMKESIHEENYTCNICEINFTSLSHWENHMKIHEEVHIVEKNTSVTNLSKTEGASIVHECESCKQIFQIKGTLYHMLKTITRRLLLCFLTEV